MMFGITPSIFVSGEDTFLKLIYMTYMLLYMLHNKMSIQRHFVPGKRSKDKGGQYSHLTFH